MPWGLWLTLLAVTLPATWKASDRGYSLLLVWGAYYAFWALADALFRDFIGAGIHFPIALLLLWFWWRRRKRRIAARVLGVVRDLGHRLTVVDVPAPAGR